MNNSDYAETLKSTLKAASIPFAAITVTDDEIIIVQDGLHEAAGAIVNELHASGLRRLDKLKSDEPVDVKVNDDLHTKDTTIVTLPR